MGKNTSNICLLYLESQVVRGFPCWLIRTEINLGPMWAPEFVILADIEQFFSQSQKHLLIRAQLKNLCRFLESFLVYSFLTFIQLSSVLHFSVNCSCFDSTSFFNSVISLFCGQKNSHKRRNGEFKGLTWFVTLLSGITVLYWFVQYLKIIVSHMFPSFFKDKGK